MGGFFQVVIYVLKCGGWNLDYIEQCVDELDEYDVLECVDQIYC